MKIEPNPAALEAMARAAYEREAEQHPVQWAVATWEQLAPNMRESWTNAAASFLQPYLDALPSDTSLQEIRERAARPNALHGCSSDPCGSAVCQTARDRDTLLAHLDAQREAQPTAPPGADAILEILNRHTYRTHTTPHSMGYWIHCACGWHSIGQQPEGHDFAPEHRAHLAKEIEALEGNTP